MFDQKIMVAIQEDALARYPEESCGAVTAAGYLPLPNMHEDKAHAFNCYEAVARIQVAGELLAVVHSHPDTFEGPSAFDMRQQTAMNVPWGIVWTDGRKVGTPYFWGDMLPIPPLERRDFRHGPSGSDGRGDCYALIRDYYRLEKKIEVPDFPRNDVWWRREGDEANLYLDNFAKAGFVEVDRHTPEVGDVFLAQIRSPVPNHGGIFMGGQLILHHPANRLSCLVPLVPWTKHISHWLRHA